MYDILIKNGTVIDGAGKPRFAADVCVKKDKIAKIGKTSFAHGKIEIDAAGKIVAPGFIDAHNHSDSYWQLFLEPELPSLVRQGVTTIVGGNCGASIAPLTDGHVIESIQKWADIKKVNVDWLSLGELAEKMKSKKIAVNFATLTGHGTLRRGVVLDEMRRLDRSELDVVDKLLEKSLTEGSLGLSAGLAYSHEKAATREELAELAQIVKKHERVFSIHLRDEASDIIPALKEAIDLAKQTGVSVEISHFKIMGESNWPLMDEALDLMEGAHNSGCNINFDVYPYTQIGSVLYVYLPAWVAEGGKKALLKRLKDKAVKERVISEMKETAKYHYEDATIAACSFSKSLNKRKISDIAFERGTSSEEVIIDLLLAGEGRVVTLLDCLSEDHVKKLIAHPLALIASDGIGYGTEHAKTGELVHPRSFGTFPRVLGKYVRDEKLLTLEDAVKKMTSMPAQKFGISGRGILQKNSLADIVIFDPEKIADKATIENPYQYPEGISEVIVNGKLAMRGCEQSKEMGGEFLTA